jgi:predicted short-subunit dehydrogenase-like oxidoreductase (DUF2520 family)
MRGFRICRIVSRSEASGTALAESCGAKWSSVPRFTGSEDIIITAVSDDSLAGVLRAVTCSASTLVAHTAGSFGLDVFPSHLKHKGVFYPLQTFSENRQINFENLPFFLEASDKKSLSLMTGLARSAGGRVYITTSEERRKIHLAAVFVCNFTNHMFTLGRDIAGSAGLTFDILEPLVNETVSKAFELGPQESQTGPAYRFDKSTLKRHIDLLSFSPEMQKIYRELTQSIINYYNREENDQF